MESKSSEQNGRDSIYQPGDICKEFLEAAKMECDFWDISHIVRVKEVIDKRRKWRKDATVL